MAVFVHPPSAWSSKSREIFSKDFDSETNYSGRRSITHFYNSDFKSGSNLCVEFLVDGKSNTGRVHFTINGEDQWVTFGNGAPKVWYGYLRLSSEGNGSKVGVTAVSKKNEETLQLYSSPPRRICLLINNVPNSGMVEKKFNDLFEYLSFRVEVKRDLGSIEMLKKAQKFAKKDHRNIDILAVVIMTISNQCNEIYCADGRNACLEQVMMEYTATRCPSLKGKPKLFFIHRFSNISSTTNDLCSRQAHDSCAENYVQDSPHCSVITRDSCPEEADFLLHGVKSTYPTHENNGVPESFFIQSVSRENRAGGDKAQIIDLA
ncbi:Caspase-9 [Stylophora pistillata]|uniref:Caspase-9 n=1 Tax=Stylophora pistillata TaxID=50429 RepID=A0A2B4SVG3_STYPI|nr:Caspase-9 [Stylophora pistillata]